MRVRPHLITLFGAAAIAAGCIPVQIQAPDEPIEINLNVNIRQEVIVRLERDAAEMRGESRHHRAVVVARGGKAVDEQQHRALPLLDHE